MLHWQRKGKPHKSAPICSGEASQSASWPHHSRTQEARFRGLRSEKGLTNDAAIDLEMALIGAIGRTAVGGPLVNLSDGGEGREGFRHSKETMEKLRGPKSEAQSDRLRAMAGNWKGRKQTPEHSAKIRAARTGTRQSEETKRKISEKKRGVKHSLEQIAAKVATMNRPEVVAKIKVARSKQICSAETRAKMTAYRLGRKHPPRSSESIERYRVSAQAREAKKRAAGLTA